MNTSTIGYSIGDAKRSGLVELFHDGKYIGDVRPKKHSYGALPTQMGIYNINVEESMFYLYMPIKLARSTKIHIPDRLLIFEPLIHQVIYDLRRKNAFWKNHIYITVKHLFVTPEYLGNRPGYHSDGFMTEDLNYVWCDKNPTIFNSTDFVVSQDDVKSLKQFEQQALIENEVTYPEYSLLKLDEYCIHKVAGIAESGMRTFVKISVSKDRYDLIGNTHNYGLRYNWDMKGRKTERNIPQSKINM